MNQWSMVRNSFREWSIFRNPFRERHVDTFVVFVDWNMLNIRSTSFFYNSLIVNFSFNITYDTFLSRPICPSHTPTPWSTSLKFYPSSPILSNSSTTLVDDVWPTEFVVFQQQSIFSVITEPCLHLTSLSTELKLYKTLVIIYEKLIYTPNFIFLLCFYTV